MIWAGGDLFLFLLLVLPFKSAGRRDDKGGGGIQSRSSGGHGGDDKRSRSVIYERAVVRKRTDGSRDRVGARGVGRVPEWGGMRSIVELGLGLMMLRCFPVSGKRTRSDVRGSIDVHILNGLNRGSHVAIWPCCCPAEFDKPYLDELNLEVEFPTFKSSTCMSINRSKLM